MQGVTDWLAMIGAWGSMLLPVLVVLGFWGGILWLGLRRRRRKMARRRAKGALPHASFLQGGDLPLQYRYVADLGTRDPAPVTVGERVLRPSVGVRIVVLGIAGLVCWYALSPEFWRVEFGPADAEITEVIFAAARVLLPLAALSGVLYIFTSEARFDRDVLIVTRFLQRREYRWKNLTRVADAGPYDILLVFKPGGKAKVLKHSAGIREFKEFAVEQVRRNGLTNA